MATRIAPSSPPPGSAGQTPAFDTQAFRRACGQFATGVTVVTLRDGDGARGITVNSFTSVSLDPPLVLVSIDRRARVHDLFDRWGCFAVNVLPASASELSDRFAGRHGDQQHLFDDIPHRLSDNRLPLFDGALVVFVCRLVAAHPGGDHTLFVGQVEEWTCAPHGAPLLFFRGRYAGCD